MGLRTIVGVLVVVGCVVGQRRPPNYSLDEMPDIQTAFSCQDKILGGYYSDPETDCQMFHVCVRVQGVGVQDFRFLCPNDTAFDQENQICDDWYNIDCEASTLYYSDNFDLFRLGHDDNGFSPVKATPIPLGPSSAPRIAPRPKPARPHAPINNAVSENDDDLYLQRADNGDRRVSQDLLRGSSSGNFFNNRNGGKEDPDDDYVAPSHAREQDLVKQSPKKKNKNQVRKLLTGKRPVTQAPTEAPQPTTTTSYYNRYNTVQRNRPTTTTENYPTTVAPAQTFNNNFNSQRFNTNQQPSTADVQRFRNNQNFAFNKKPSTTEYFQETTTAAAYNFRGNNYYQQQSSTAAPAYSQGNNNYYQTQSSTTVAPTNYKTNYNQGNNYYQTPTTVAPQYNYNQQTSTLASTVYNAYQNRASQQPTTNNNNYQNTNYQNTNYQQNTNNYQAYNSPSTDNVNANYDATTLKQNYYQKQTTVNYDNYYKTSTNAPFVAYSTTVAPEAQNYNYDSSANVFQQTKDQYNYNINAAGSTTVNYNPYNSYKESNDGYDEPSQGESLKTAPSSNIRPSDLNAIAKSYQKPSGFNASLSASYNFVNPSTTQKPTSKLYNAQKQFQSTVRQTTVKQFQQSPTTVLPPSRGNAYYAQSTTAASLQPRPFSKVPEGTAAPKGTKEKDASYDYAYYDEGTGSEYDGIDTIGEEFSRTTSHKHSRTTPQ